MLTKTSHMSYLLYLHVYSYFSLSQLKLFVEWILCKWIIYIAHNSLTPIVSLLCSQFMLIVLCHFDTVHVQYIYTNNNKGRSHCSDLWLFAQWFIAQSKLKPTVWRRRLPMRRYYKKFIPHWGKMAKRLLYLPIRIF